MSNNLYTVASSPHARSKDSVQGTMRDVLIALSPAALFSIFYFGIDAALTILVCVVASMFAEWIYNRITDQKSTIMDLSAAVTGLLLAMNLPGNMPLQYIWWISILGSFFAIIVVKQLFGGLGQNFMNPALAARAFLLVSFAKVMTTWGPTIDGVSTATPLGIMKEGAGELPSIMSTFLGTIPGSLGETSALALIIGGLYLIYRKVISWRIPVIYVGTTAVMVLLLTGFDMTMLGYHLFSGGLMLGAIFMATDYASSPTTAKGQIIMGIGCGVLTVLIRLFGNNPEGVSFAIIIMNLFVPLIDKYTVPVKFGEVK